MPAKSPFPGMDPWLEQYWGDVHQAFVTYARDAIQERLPSDLRARMQERLAVEQVDESRQIVPDVTVAPAPNAARPAQRREPGVATLERDQEIKPVIIKVRDEPVRQGNVEIIDLREGGRVVTIIEVLSLANKTPGAGQELYQRKQREVKAARVNLVEIDLLRAGSWSLAFEREDVPEKLRDAQYFVSIWRAGDPGEHSLYCIPITKRLLAIPIPLRAGEAEIWLELQELIDKAYRNGAYDTIDYGRKPEPGLWKAEEEWVRGVLAARG